MDSINAWPTILTPNATSQIGRQEVPLDLSENGLGCFFPNGSITGASCALIVGDYKLVTGAQNCLGYWTGPRHPNETLYDPCNQGCPNGCLFNLRTDPVEQNDLRHSAAHATLWTQISNRAQALAKTVWSTNWTGPATDCVNKTYYKALWGCHRGPACFEPGKVPPLPAGSTGPDGLAMCSLVPKERGGR